MAPHAKRKALGDIDTNRARLPDAHTGSPAAKRQRTLPAPCTSPRHCPRPSGPEPPISSEPPQSTQILNDSSDYNYDPLWYVLRQLKARRYLQQAQPEANMAGSKSTTSSENLEKGNKRWKESYLHPRFIRIQEGSDLNDKPSSEHLEDMRHSSPTEKGERDTIGIGTFIEGLTEDLLKEMQDWAFTLGKFQANEARWEIDYWQRYFLKTSRQLDSMKTTQAPIIHRIPQASIAIAHDRARLTPLIADSPEDRRESGLLVGTSVWQPSFSSKSQADRIWYPDHQYAITTKRFAPGRQIDSLPFFRLAQTSYLPPHLLVEVKANAKRTDWEQTQNSLAFLTAYLLHERLLLRFLSQNVSIEQSQSIDVEDLYVHALSLCGAEAKIWRMHVRSGDDLTDLPIRYDMHLIAKLDSADEDHAQQLRSWINAINAHAQAVMFPSLQQDFKSYGNLHKTKETTRLQDIGFVYVESGDGEKKIAAKRLKDLREAFRKGVIRPDERIGDNVIFEIDEDGNAMEMPTGFDHTFLTPPESDGSVATVGSGQSERAPALVLDVHGGPVEDQERQDATSIRKHTAGTAGTATNTGADAKAAEKLPMPIVAEPLGPRRSSRRKK